jgi:phage shock protein A
VYTGIAIFLALLAVAVAAVVLLVNRRAAGQAGYFAKSQVGKAGRWFGRQDPVGQMRQAADDAKGNIAQAREALVRAEAMKSSLERQIRADRSEEATLTARIHKRLDAGAAPADPDVGRLAEALARAKKSLAANEQQLRDNAEFYDSTLRAAQGEAAKIGDIERRADRLQVRLDLSDAQGKLAELANRFKPGAMNGAAKTAAEFEEVAERKIEENRARLKVGADFGGADPEGEAVSAEADAALAGILAGRTGKAAGAG